MASGKTRSGKPCWRSSGESGANVMACAFVRRRRIGRVRSTGHREVDMASGCTRQDLVPGTAVVATVSQWQELGLGVCTKWATGSVAVHETRCGKRWSSRRLAHLGRAKTSASDIARATDSIDLAAWALGGVPRGERSRKVGSGLHAWPRDVAKWLLPECCDRGLARSRLAAASDTVCINRCHSRNRSRWVLLPARRRLWLSRRRESASSLRACRVGLRSGDASARNRSSRHAVRVGIFRFVEILRARCCQ